MIICFTIYGLLKPLITMFKGEEVDFDLIFHRPARDNVGKRMHY